MVHDVVSLLRNLTVRPMIILKVDTLGDSLKFRLSEWGLSVIMLCFGFILLHPYDTLAAPVYALMRSTASEMVWGWGCFILGATRLIVLIINGAWKRSPHFRAFAAFLSCFVWVQIALSLSVGGTLPTGIAVYSVFVIMDMVSAYRAAADARVSDEAARNDGKY